MRYYRDSPPYYKDLGSPPRLTASPMQRTWEARPTAGGGIAASQKPLGVSPTHPLAVRSQTQADPKNASWCLSIVLGNDMDYALQQTHSTQCSAVNECLYKCIYR